MESILKTIKRLLGIAEEDTSFDEEVIVDINSVFTITTQLGVGVDNFSISDYSATWEDFVEPNQIELIKTYVYLKVRMMFDPPTSSTLQAVITQQISEFEWRLTNHS